MRRSDSRAHRSSLTGSSRSRPPRLPMAMPAIPRSSSARRASSAAPGQPSGTEPSPAAGRGRRHVGRRSSLPCRTTSVASFSSSAVEAKRNGGSDTACRWTPTSSISDSRTSTSYMDRAREGARGPTPLTCGSSRTMPDGTSSRSARSRSASQAGAVASRGHGRRAPRDGGTAPAAAPHNIDAHRHSRVGAVGSPTVCRGRRTATSSHWPERRRIAMGAAVQACESPSGAARRSHELVSDAPLRLRLGAGR